MAKTERKNDKKSPSIFFTAEVFGLALALLCVLSLLCLTIGDLIFGEVGVIISAFYLGLFGYFAFPILLASAFLGVKLLIGFKVENEKVKRVAKYLALYLFFAGLVAHAALTPHGAPFGEYVKFCYENGVSLSQTTPGGVLFGLLTNPLSNLLTPFGSYCLYFILLATTTLVLARKRILTTITNARNNPKRAKKSVETEESEEDEEVDTFENPVSEVDKSDRRIIFGGGAFEMKSSEDKKKSGSSVKVLFDDQPFSRKSRGESFNSSPVTPTSSYREAYDRDIENKTQFIRKPYSPTKRTVVSPMGGRDPEPFEYTPPVTEKMDIDVSEPEKDVYVFNTRGKPSSTIPGFEDRARATTFESEKSTTTNTDEGYNVSRFSPELSNRDFTGGETRSRGYEEPRNTSFGYGERRSTFGETQTQPETTFGSMGERGDRYGQSTWQSETRTPVGSDDYRGGRGENSRSNPFEQPDSATTASQTNFTEPVNSRTSFMDEGFGGERRENPLTKAMRESEVYNKPEETPSLIDEFERDQTTSSYDEDNSFGASYFSADENRRSPKVTFGRDRAHSTPSTATPVSKPSEPTPTVKKPAEPTFSTSSTPIKGKQISMEDIPDENKLINPIDNIPKNYKYAFPPLSLLLDYNVDENARKKNEEEQLKRADTICQILNNSNIEAKIEDIKYGPAITRFELSIPPKVSIKRVTEKYEDLNLWIAARDKIRLVAPIQGTSRIGIEVPNASPATVGLKGLIESKEFKLAKQTSLSFCLGKDIVGKPVILDISKMPHLLVAGATGTGKSVFLNTLLMSLIYKYSPEELRIILVDPKVVEFSIFKGIPNLMFNEIFTDNARVCSMLEWAVQEMEERYRKLNDVLTKNIDEYNAYMEKKKGKKIPKILIIIDEFADLMNSSSERKLLENKISRLAAKARAAGIHLIMATQRPSADIMEGSIKTNFTSRIAFKMSSSTDAVVIMGESGAEKLLGRGDVLFRTSTMPSSERAQGCFVDTPEIDAVCRYVKEHNECYYDEFALEKILKGAQTEDSAPATSSFEGGSDTPAKSDDELIKKAMRFAISANNISISGMQRKLGIGFPKAGKLMDTLVEKGYVSETVDNKNRKILMTKEQFEEVFGEPF